jgi:quercetin dioxygenase-like cupin family protein
MSFSVRRIVTGHDAQGRSIIADAFEVRSTPGKMQPSVDIANFWINETMPPAIDGDDPRARDFPVLPTNGGAVFRMLELAPGTEPFMHATRTIDYVVVTAGELTMILGDGVELVMKERDVLIQRATVHGWANRGSAPCRFATVVIDATPVS